MEKEIITDASIPGNGFRLADKYHADVNEWHRTCLDFLKTGEVFRFVTQDGATDGKAFCVVEPLELVRVRDFSKCLPSGQPDPGATKLAYHGGKMKFEKASEAT